jgi:hypothetical protein
MYSAQICSNLSAKREKSENDGKCLSIGCVCLQPGDLSIETQREKNPSVEGKSCKLLHGPVGWGRHVIGRELGAAPAQYLTSIGSTKGNCTPVPVHPSTPTIVMRHYPKGPVGAWDSMARKHRGLSIFKT